MKDYRFFFTSDGSHHKPLGVACAVGLVGCCVAETAVSVCAAKPAAVLAVVSAAVAAVLARCQ